MRQYITDKHYFDAFLEVKQMRDVDGPYLIYKINF